MYLPNKRPENMERITTLELANKFIDEQVKLVQEQVGDKKVLLALSGGVDSSVVAALLIKAIGKLYGGLNPMVTFAATDTGNISAAVIANTNDNALILRCTNGSGGHDDYALPSQSGTGYHAYKIVNTKEGVLALVEHTETITVAANTWTEINITQFYPPTGYHLLAMHLAGSTDYNARNNLYVMLNSLNNANRMLVYCSQALTNVDITLDAWFIRDEDYLTLTP